MEWVFRNPQILSTFSHLGFMHTDGYHINENCNAALEIILNNILTEDKYLRGYRRSIGFGQNIKKDLIPLLIHAKEDKTIELLVAILVNLSIPIECLISVEVTAASNVGLHTLFEINKLLTSAKDAFTAYHATKVVVGFLKKNVDSVHLKVSAEQSENISNSLLLLRNILHVPEEAASAGPVGSGSGRAVQNQIIWNIFSQSIDKVLIQLINLPEATNWGVTIVQLIALLYKDQHVVSLHKLIEAWLATSRHSESSEDNESNTSPPHTGSEDSLPMLSSDPGSDSSDIQVNEPSSDNSGWGTSSEDNTMKDGGQPSRPPRRDGDDSRRGARGAGASISDKRMKFNNGDIVISEFSQTVISNNKKPTQTNEKIEKHEPILASSDDDELPSKRPMRQKPTNPKQRVNNTKARIAITFQEQKHLKIVSRGRANLITVQGLTLQAPTDEDIANVLKGFTIDFLLNGYNSLVQLLHSEVITNLLLEIDTSHFFWIVTYFLRFAAQIELDFKRISSVLCFDIVSYLTSEAVNLCEQFELAVKVDGSDLKQSCRQLHLVVTAIREFVQAVEVYKESPHVCDEDKQILNTLQNKMSETDEVRSLLVLLLRLYNPQFHSKQYLQDLIITNHKLLIFVDSAMRRPNYTGSTNMKDHIKQFATPEMMCRYGLLLEDFAVNGEFLNDCVFTIMHHVGGELDTMICLFQPKILRTFTTIWRTKFEICDEWFDLVHYVINTFEQKPHALLNSANFRLHPEIFALEQFAAELPAEVAAHQLKNNKAAARSTASHSLLQESWTVDELLSLDWNHLQFNSHPDALGEILQCMEQDGTLISRESLIKELYKRKITHQESSISVPAPPQINEATREVGVEKLCEQLRQDGKCKYFEWLQRALLETCHAKLQIEKTNCKKSANTKEHSDILQFKLFKQNCVVPPIVSPVSYHALLLEQAVPLVPWNCEQAVMNEDLLFLQILHKLGFQMPVDTGKLFIRIPHAWSADVLYNLAGRVADIDTGKLKFSLSDITRSGAAETTPHCSSASAADAAAAADEAALQDLQVNAVTSSMRSAPDNLYQTREQNHVTVVNFAHSERAAAEGAAPTVITHCPDSENLNRDSDTESVASDLIRLYVSDEDEEEPQAAAPRPGAGGSELGAGGSERGAGESERDAGGSKLGAGGSERGAARKRARDSGGPRKRARRAGDYLI